MTPINNLKQWFRNGLKPTQEQFWAWMDSYWHKGEKIPQASIEGLDKSLENKAETSAVEAKANKDATGLSDDNVAKWKEALGVGEVPDNMATIDKDGVLGNVHTKEQITELLESSGTNLGNSDLKVPEGEDRELDLTGVDFRFKGVQSAQGDASFNKRPKFKSDGTFGMVEENVVVKEDLMKALTLMSDTEKEALRRASLKTTERYSLGQAVVEGFDFPLLDRSLNYTQYRSIIGVNLFIDNTSNSSAQVKLIKRGSGEEYIINNFETFQTNPSVLTFAITEGMLPVGIYDVKVLHNGVWSIVNSAAALYVQDGIQSHPLPSLTWVLRDKNGALPPAYANGGDGNGVSGDATSLSARMRQTSDLYIAISQVPILTPEEMQRGVMLEFDVDISTDSIALTTFSMGITDNNASINSNLTVGFGKTAGAEISYAPSSVRKTLVSEGKGYSRSIRDKMIWLIKDGLITIYFKSQGRGATQPLDTSKNYYLKLVMSGNPNPAYYWSDMKINLTGKKLI